MYNNMWGF